MEHPSSLLYQIATNVSLNLIRSKKRRPEDATEDDVLTRIAYAPENDGRSVARLTLDRIFGNEQTSTRTMAVLHLLDGHTLEEVAEITGMSVSGVRKRLRGLQAHVNELESIQEGVQ
jgi:RNA polymerase sigma-70 factor (ECF subfamily)